MATSSGKKREGKHEGPNHQGPASTSPYPVSRLAPRHDLVDVARQIQDADEMLGAVTGNQLRVIATQIRSLQDMARDILHKARHDAALHRAACQFERRPGGIYHLYQRQSGQTFFSLVGPEEWGGPPPQRFIASYRLEPDMSWTPIEDIAAHDEDVHELPALLGPASRRSE